MTSEQLLEPEGGFKNLVPTIVPTVSFKDAKPITYTCEPCGKEFRAKRNSYKMCNRCMRLSILKSWDVPEYLDEPKFALFRQRFNASLLNQPYYQ